MPAGAVVAGASPERVLGRGDDASESSDSAAVGGFRDGDDAGGGWHLCLAGDCWLEFA